MKSFIQWLVCLCCLWLYAAPVHATTIQNSIYLYSSPLTQTFFAANGSNYDTLKSKWRAYLKQYGRSFQEVSRADLLAGLKPGVLILGSAVLLDEQERNALRAYTTSGGNLLLTWGTGVRNANGRWLGYGLIEELMDIRVRGVVNVADGDHFLNTFGDSPVTWGLPAGTRLFLGLVGETPLRVSGKHIAGRYANWSRTPSTAEADGAIAFRETPTSRAVYLGFSEASWEFDSRLELPKVLDTMIAWLRREPRVFQSAWPSGKLSAHLLEMDTEDKFPNSLNFAKHLDQANIRGTFYSLTSVAKQHASVVRQLSERHEIGYHAEVHVGFKGKDKAEQDARLKVMVDEMREIVGSRALSNVTGFRAPTESWDAVTEQLLRQYGVQHHVADPSSSEARLPFFSQSEPGLNTEDAIVVLPRTQMDDLNYLALKLSFEDASKLMEREFDHLHEAGALGVLSVHSQSYGEGGLMTALTPVYIQQIEKHRKDVWPASGQEIADWWRSRARVKIADQDSSPLGLQFSVQAPGDVKGLTFFVTHPATSQPLVSVVPDQANLPRPVVRKIDAYRSAVVFQEKLSVGTYSYKINF